MHVAAGGKPALCVHWEAWDIPAGDISLPHYLGQNLTAIRGEHAAWAYDMAHIQVAGRTLETWFKAGEYLSMWWCSLLYERHPKMTPNLYTIYKLRALERLLLALPDAQGTPLALTLEGGDALLAQTLANLCAAHGWAFASKAAHNGVPAGVSLARRCYEKCPPLLRAVARYAHWLWSIRRKLPAIGELPPAAQAEQTATIATYFPNVDMDAAKEGRYRSRYWESLHDALADATGTLRWLFVRFPAPQMSLDQCIAFRDTLAQSRKDGLSFVWIEECLRHRDLWAAWRRFVRLRAASVRAEDAVRRVCHFAGSRLNFWAYVRDDYAESFRGWRALERCLQNRGLDNYVRMAGPQRWTLFPLENCPWERMLTHAVHKAAGGPVYGAQHSTIRPTDFRYFDDPRFFSGATAALVPDAVRGNGRAACAQWQDAGMPPALLGQVEALRYLYLAGGKQENGQTAQPAAGEKRELLVLTSFFRDETFAHLALLAKAAQNGLLAGWQITLKAHPYLPAAELLQHFPGPWSKDVRVADGPIAPLLRPGVLVWASNSTTAALEAAIKGLAVMVMQPTGDFDLCPMQDIPGLVRTATLDDVRQGLTQAQPPNITADYLNLDTRLSAWRQLLGLPAA